MRQLPCRISKQVGLNHQLTFFVGPLRPSSARGGQAVCGCGIESPRPVEGCASPSQCRPRRRMPWWRRKTRKRRWRLFRAASRAGRLGRRQNSNSPAFVDYTWAAAKLPSLAPDPNHCGCAAGLQLYSPVSQPDLSGGAKGCCTTSLLIIT